ncbi:MAG TPA: VOC family protein [Kouleothrix sp.]|uniref:VOC family protein n=1 Tax=Kouleothrix sp. TaxID=2779161 RepID=UPI002C573553|nr:VOC family protein [Kouleothrix sp.]HRC77353.1 VOC family protein [Kouleothrix sp.]
MPISARYVHTNLVARDWRRLASFYQDVFGCTPVPPERDFHGPAFDTLTGIAGARLRGMHLRLPGYGDTGPTLEIFEYAPAQAKPDAAVNRQGYGHIAFAVDDVARAYDTVVQAGGRPIGGIVTLEIAGGARVTVVYMADPEGNIIELQSWSQPAAPAS